jgi:hypothetical protein
MSSPKKGGNYISIKLHAGNDTKTKLIHTAKTTTAKIHDSVVMDDLLHGEEKEVMIERKILGCTRKSSKRKKNKESTPFIPSNTSGATRKFDIKDSSKIPFKHSHCAFSPTSTK